ncbi:MAG: hypothetical protein JSW26_12670 [Desulfobacterales bacterium]|nr:MAG: hypothetical protein JSW26_12670 [Desulfobacterales bacterium]
MEIPSQLISAISRISDRTASPAVAALIDEILKRHGEAALGVLLYGSCLRSGDDFDGLVDLYLLVDDYRKAFNSRMQAFVNALLPPNVYYLEREFEGNTVRTKYAVLSLADFQKGTTARWFHSYLWGRFCQPTALLYARNEDVKKIVQEGFAQSVITFIARVLPMFVHEFTAQQLWSRGLTLSYGAELRSENPAKRARLYDAAPDYYEDVTRLAMAAMARLVEIDDTADTVRYRPRISRVQRLVNRFGWRLRSVQGKLLSLLRLLKASLTFEGGVDYILWKIERHSGVAVDVEPWLKRRPVLAAGVLAWRLYRKGGFR